MIPIPCRQPPTAPLVILVWLVAATIVTGEDWPEFRGSSGQGHSRQTDLPLEWDTERNVAWKKSIPGKGWSSPIVSQGRIVLTTAVGLDQDDSSRQSLRTLCLDAATGKLLWDNEVFRTKAGPNHEKNSYASPTPITDGQLLYIHFGPDGTAALDFEGRVVWKNQTIQYESFHGGGGSPVLSGNLLIFNCDGESDPFVIALDKVTGQERWRTFRPDMEPERFAFSTPLEIECNGQYQIVSPGSNFVCSYDPEDGSEIWRVGYSKQWSVTARPVYSHGLVLITTGYPGPASLLAIRPDGSGDVTETHVVWQLDRAVPHTPSPLVVDQNIFLISDDGTASCIDLRTAEQHWRKRLGGTYSASPIHAGGRIYCQSEDGECIVFRAAEAFDELSRNDLGERSLASFAADGAALLIRTDSHLYRIQQPPN